MQGKVVVVAGPPASGKGTQCKLLARALGMIHLSTGDFFREAVRNGSELGAAAKEYLDRGDFVPDAMVISMVKTRISQPDIREHGCLLDGFPRTASQAEALAREVNVALFLVLQVPDQALIKRAESRRVDLATGDIYNLEYKPPPPELLSERLTRRKYDDDAAMFKIRLATWHELIRRVAPTFGRRVRTLDGMRPIEEVYADCERVVTAAITPAQPVAQPVAQPAAQRCAICLEAPADHLVTPCGHCCGCEACLTQVMSTSRKCPICRATIGAVQRVFRSGVDAEDEAAQLPGPIGGDSVVAAVEPMQLDSPLDDEAWPEDVVDAVDDQPDVAVTISPACGVGATGGECPMVVSVTALGEGALASRRPPIDLCCVVDISGSMGALATHEDDDGTVRDDGLSILDIVKHAVKTLAHILQEGDQMSLVVFSDTAQTVMPLTAMNTSGRTEYISALEALSPRGATSIWAGLRAGLDSLREPTTNDNFGDTDHAAPRAQTLMLLTDGRDSFSRAVPHVEELRSYRDQYPELQVQINTFGFGYNLDSELLLSLATEGSGSYAFIPDALIVGTVFVNSLASVLSTHVQESTLHLMPRGGASFAGAVSGGHVTTEESWGRVVALGPLQYGQPREVAVPMRLPPLSDAQVAGGDVCYLEAVLEYKTPADATARRAQGLGVAREGGQVEVVAALRCETVTVGYAALQLASDGRGQAAVQAVEGLVERLSSALTIEDERAAASATTAPPALIALHADVSGRMSKALRGKKRFDRWGKHYLRALMRSHELQQCSNFMDPGLQHYGGAAFKEMRQRGDGIFLSLPAPVPQSPRDQYGYSTRRGRSTTGGAQRATAAAPAPAVDMRTYYAGAGGGCFGGDSTVLVARSAGDGFEPCRIRHVRAGDRVMISGGDVALVRCLVRIRRLASKPLIALTDGLTITPSHPVRIDGVWRRADAAFGARLVEEHDGCVFTLVLDEAIHASDHASQRVLLVGGVECVTWGHGLLGPVVGHRFFGTHSVLEDVAAMGGWASGFVAIDGCLRDAASNEVVGLREEQVGKA